MAATPPAPAVMRGVVDMGPAPARCVPGCACGCQQYGCACTEPPHVPAGTCTCEYNDVVCGHVVTERTT